MVTNEKKSPDELDQLNQERECGIIYADNIAEDSEVFKSCIGGALNGNEEVFQSLIQFSST